MSVFKKLMQARVELQAKKLNKSGNNTFAGYQYFELSDFLPSVNEIFNTIGLCGVVSYGNDIATLEIIDIDDGKSINITSPMSEANLKGCHPIQNLGAVQTYIRRYLWITAMEIVEHDALDATSGDRNNKPQPKENNSVTTKLIEKINECETFSELLDTWLKIENPAPAEKSAYAVKYKGFSVSERIDGCRTVAELEKHVKCELTESQQEEFNLKMDGLRSS